MAMKYKQVLGIAKKKRKKRSSWNVGWSLFKAGFRRNAVMWLAVTGPAHLTNGISWIEGKGLQGPLDVHFRHMLLKFGNSFFLTADQLSKRFHFFQNLFQLGFTFLLRKKKYKRKIKDNYLYIVFSFLLLFLFRIKWAFIRQVCSNKEFVVVFQELLAHTYMYTYSFCSHVIYVKVRGKLKMNTL